MRLNGHSSTYGIQMRRLCSTCRPIFDESVGELYDPSIRLQGEETEISLMQVFSTSVGPVSNAQLRGHD